MKLVDTNNSPLTVTVDSPLTLGERGRGRWYEEVRIDARNPPMGGDYGVRQFEVNNAKHAVLTAPTGQRGLLLVVRTKGTYTRDSYGNYKVYGEHDEMAKGSWACGDAGNIGSGDDGLIWIQGPAVVAVTYSGGSHKGWGKRYVFVHPARGYVRELRPRDAIQEIVTDADPMLGDILRSLKALPNDLAEALSQGQILEDAAPASIVRHFGDLSLLADAGLVGAPSWEHTHGVARIDAGVVWPGDRSLVCLSVGPGGGKRYSYSDLVISGVDVVASTPIRTSGNHSSRERVIGIISEPTWSIMWTEWKDGQETARCRADVTGIDRGYGREDWA